MKEVTVVLSPAFDQTFRRGVRDKDGKRVDTLFFTRGEPVRVPYPLFGTIKRDIGNALLVCKESKNGVLRADHGVTATFKEYLDTQWKPLSDDEFAEFLEEWVEPEEAEEDEEAPQDDATVDEPSPADQGTPQEDAAGTGPQETATTAEESVGEDAPQEDAAQPAESQEDAAADPKPPKRGRRKKS